MSSSIYKTSYHVITGMIAGFLMVNDYEYLALIHCYFV
ncbi:hypothetical protein FQV37_1115 [Psychrobacter nivimaris]|uniref:Uncharacterized protein n=1 Tax=Psychrobacter nivimaris TaxID=281738 RepID=A0A6N7BWN4_9GAMM|nr:hypothetical protein FQV37_1115 [Psychrobacter nivimaris]